MANSGKDTNGSQFFITTAITRFAHSFPVARTHLSNVANQCPQLVRWKARRVWRGIGRVWCGWEDWECAQGCWRQAAEDCQNRQKWGAGQAGRRYTCGAMITQCISSCYNSAVMLRSCWCFGLVYKDLIGSALPAQEGDELDVTLPKSPTPSKKPEHNADDAVAVSVASSGSSLLQKLIFFGVIIGGVSIWIKARKSRSAGEKSLAWDHKTI